jgi:uncharacterized protein YjdB
MTATFFATSCEEEQAGEVPATGVTLSAPTLTLPLGSTETLTAIVAPDNASDKALTWRSNKPAVVSVSADGQVTALTVGSATVTATTANGVKGTCVVTVIPVAVTSVTLSETSLNLPIGEAATLTATVAPDNATDKTLTWSSSNEDVATVSQTGEVTSVAVGAATITAAANNGVEGVCAVTVSTIEVTALTLSETSLSLIIGGTETLVATVSPDNATDKSITWSSNATDVATVDNDGVVTAVAIGAATITVSATNGVTATCAVTVGAVPVTNVSLDATTANLKPGETKTLVATVAPDNATDKSITWSSNATGVATVSQTGVVTAVAVGAATITVTSNSDNTKTATCVVTVSPVAVTGVSLNKTSLALEISHTETLVATVAPEDATNKNVTWSSNATNIATVDNNGVVTAVAVGAATITVTTADGSKTATCAVTVASSIVNVTGVSLNKTTTSITIGETETLTATVAPTNATDKSVTWSSNATNIATVDNNGVVTAVAVGAATITVTSNADNTKTATCVVTVTPVAVTGVSLNKTTTSITTGETETLTATVLPANATDKTVTWSSSNTGVATVSQSGVVTGVAGGSAVITVTSNADNTKTATCAVTVTVPPATSMQINLDGTTGTGVELTYTDNTTENLTITNNAVTVSTSTKIIKSIKIDAGAVILIGRKADSDINLKINGTALALRDADGSGVIPIGTYAELQLINKDNNTKAGNYKQEADIDLMNESWKPISTFTGTFDGARHTVANLFINTNAGNQGLFGEINGATIKNIGVMSGSVTSTSGGAASIAGLVGRLTGSSVLYACFNNADVTGSANQTGGLVGYVISPAGAQIIACYNTGDVQAYAYVGGIVGYQHQGTLDVIACYNTGNITASGSNAAGIHPNANASKMIACYNTGIITKGSSIGSNGTACYSANNTSKNNATEFSATAWPSASINAEWGTGDGSGSGTYWKSLGSWNDGSPVYPKLFFE